MTSGDTFGVTSTGRLVTFDRADPALDTAVAISGLQTGETVIGIDVRAGGATPGQLYALGSTGRLYTVDTTSGVATLKSTLTADPSDVSDPFTALSGTEFGIDFDPAGDRLRVVSDTGQNLRIDADSGATITDTALSSGGSARTGITGAAYTNAFASACRAAIYYIDSTTDQLLTTSDPNGGAVTVVGALGVDASAAGDLEIATAADGTNTGYAVLVVGGVPTSYQIDLSTGIAATAGPVTRLESGELVRDTAIAAPATDPAQAAGDVFALTESGRLISFVAARPDKTCTNATFTGQQGGETIVNIDVRPVDGALYALGSTGRLYTVDTASAALTLKTTLVAALGDVTTPYAGLTGTVFGADFNPGNDLLRVVSDTGLNFRVAPDTGATTTDVALNPVGPVAAAGAYSNSFVGTFTSFFYVIDSVGDAVQVLGRPSGNAINGDLQLLGALGVGDVQSIAGFDIFGVDNRGIAALNLAGESTSSLYSIHLGTGAATRLATIGGGERVRGLAYAQVPVATVHAITTADRLVTFAPLTPGTFASDVAITGLQGGENIVGIDFSPANGALYALGSAGRIYTLDPDSGAATAVVSLSAEPLDATAPYTGLVGAHFDVDFSSLDGVLRVQSDAGQNLRVNVDTGLVITDGAPNPGTPQLAGTAFTNSFAGATASVHHALDLATASLVRQTSISGALATVGPFNAGVAFEPGGAFDIVGGDNGLAIAALQPAGSAQSTIYRVNLGNGALTALGTAGSSATVIKAMSVRLR